MKTASRIRRRIDWAIRDRFPNRRVVRTIQGVEMTLPWSHRLPDYTRDGSVYGQNLVELARALAPAEGPVVVIDIGANVGDSALQVLDATDARFICVEADDYYLDYLRTNVGDDERCQIEPALLIPDNSASTNVSVVREGGTARFVESSSSTSDVSGVTPAELRARHPWTADLRLVKSDTDGYDVALVPALAAEFADLSPVLFFEYDQRLSRIAGFEPTAVWSALADLGYTEVAIWDHGGAPVGRIGIEDVAVAAKVLDNEVNTKLRAYWDVAVVHGQDASGLAAITALVPRTL